MKLKEEMERLALKYPEHANFLLQGILVEEVLDAELAEFQKNKKNVEVK